MPALEVMGVQTASLVPKLGERWALIGRNAVGKTTLLGRLARTHRAQAALMSQHTHDAFALPVHAWLDLHASPAQKNGQEFFELANALNIAHLLKRPVTELSGGERQRVGLAAVYVQKKPWWLLDEPVSAQDPAHQLLIARWLLAQSQVLGVALVFVVHDINWLARVASHVYALQDQVQPIAGPVSQVLNAQTLHQVYGCSWQQDNGVWLMA